MVGGDVPDRWVGQKPEAQTSQKVLVMVSPQVEELGGQPCIKNGDRRNRELRIKSRHISKESSVRLW